MHVFLRLPNNAESGELDLYASKKREEFVAEGLRLYLSYVSVLKSVFHLVSDTR